MGSGSGKEGFGLMIVACAAAELYLLEYWRAEGVLESGIPHTSRSYYN